MKIAVIVNEEDAHRQSEALRVALGLTLCDDIVDLFIVDKELKRNEYVEKNLAMLRSTGGEIYSNKDGNGFKRLSIREIARKIVEYDLVVPY
jgi:hypothetical protein